MAKKVDPLKAKQAKQKKIAIGGGVLLLALLAFQVPRTMKMLHSGGNVTTSAATTTAATTPGSTPLAPPTLDGSSGATAPASGVGSGSASSGSAGSPAATSADGVVDATSALPASSGQLISFSRFKSKDPFVQQIEDCTTDCSSSGGADSGPASGGGSGAGSGSGSGTSGGGGSGGTSPSAGGSGSAAASGGAAAAGTTATPSVTTAAISVNGAVSKMTVGQTFPAGSPVFVLRSLTHREAKIAIAGGSLANGATTVALKRGKTLTLQNTADGTRYALKLVSTA